MNRENTYNVLIRHLLRARVSMSLSPTMPPAWSDVAIADRTVALGIDEGQIRLGEPGRRPYATFPLGKRYNAGHQVNPILDYVRRVGTTPESVIRAREAKEASDALLARMAKAQRGYQERLNAILAPVGASHGWRKVDPELVTSGRMPVRVTFEAELTSDQIRALYRAYEEVLGKPGRAGNVQPMTAYQHLEED